MSRVVCKKCLKPASVCLCGAAEQQDNSIPILVLRHSDEVSKALNTASLLPLVLRRVMIVDGVDFSKSVLEQWMLSQQVHRPALLYPKPFPESPSFIVCGNGSPDKKSIELHKLFDSVVVIDGSWRNSREILACNTWLRSIAVVCLESTLPSDYRIRKSSQENSLSTIEAVGTLLTAMQAGLDSEKILKPFRAMIDMQIERMGLETYLNNYCS